MNGPKFCCIFHVTFSISSSNPLTEVLVSMTSQCFQTLPSKLNLPAGGAPAGGIQAPTQNTSGQLLRTGPRLPEFPRSVQSVAYLEIRHGGGQASRGRQFPTRWRPQMLKRLRQMMAFVAGGAYVLGDRRSMRGDRSISMNYGTFCYKGRRYLQKVHLTDQGAFCSCSFPPSRPHKYATEYSNSTNNQRPEYTRPPLCPAPYLESPDEFVGPEVLGDLPAAGRVQDGRRLAGRAGARHRGASLPLLTGSRGVHRPETEWVRHGVMSH